MAVLIAKTRKTIEEMDSEDPNLKKIYYEKYVEARKNAGIVTDTKEMQESFMKYFITLILEIIIQKPIFEFVSVYKRR